MRKSIVSALIVSAAMVSPLAARAVKTVTPLPNELVGAARITTVEVVVNESARKAFDALEDKAANKKSAPAPVSNTAATPDELRAESYAAMPFADMFPHVVQDELAGRKLTSGRPLKLTLHLDTLKTADAGMALLIGSVDELAGVITLSDATTGETLGEYYIDVFNSRSGLLGLALRGSGVREKLAAEFAKHIGEVLGKKPKPVSA